MSNAWAICQMRVLHYLLIVLQEILKLDEFHIRISFMQRRAKMRRKASRVCRCAIQAD